MYLQFKWTVSRSRNSYGYNVCSLFVDGAKVSSCNGGGYDLTGTALGNWMAFNFKDELLKFKSKFYGLTFHDPNYDAGKKVINDQTIEEREKEGKSLGLERYQSFYSASSKLPTKNHIIPMIDGACGFSQMERILKALGYYLECVNYKTNSQEYILKKVS